MRNCCYALLIDMKECEIATKLFRKKDDEEKQSERLYIRLTVKDMEAIRTASSVRRLDVSEFARRAMLGRRADVRYKGQIILEIRAVVAALKQQYKGYVERGLLPPEEEFRALINESIEAMKRISK
jgi:uncharacterized protein (DUF1778 family)